MKEMIHGYEKGCELVRRRIDELNVLMKELKTKGDTDAVAELNLEQRIRLLYVEHRQAQEIISHLSAYMRRKGQNVKTDYLL